VAIPYPERAPLDPRSQAFVAAIHAVINADRTLTEHELLITTACELLVEGALETAELARQVDEVWSGADVPQALVEAALHTASDAGLMVSTSDRRKAFWSLTPAGRAGAGGAREWAENAYARTARRLRELAAKDCKLVSDAEARLWVDLLARALSDGIREAYTAFVGDVSLLIDGTIVPKKFERARAFYALRATAELDTWTTDFLEAAVVKALDPTDLFGNDLVSHIATGCVLLAFLAGRDRADARERLQDLSGEEFVLDTPVLALLIGSSSEAEPILRSIHATVSAGGRVVVTDHTVEEFLELVESIGARQIPALTPALHEGLNAQAYCATVDSSAPETWVAALDEGRYESWDQFEKEAHRIRARLEELHVSVRPAGNYIPETVTRCREALTELLTERHHDRGEVAIERDAQTMAMVLRHRVRRNGIGRLWPGSWIVTSDRHIGPAYRRVSRKDGVPVTLTITQWAVMMLSCRPTVTVKELASVTAPLVTRLASLAIAARYPADVALQIAKMLAPEKGPAGVNLRLAQIVSADTISLDTVLDPKTGLPAGMTPVSLASEVLTRRERRMEAQVLVFAARAEEDRLRAQAEVLEAEQRAQREKYAREQTEKQLKDSTNDIETLKRDLSLAEDQLVKEKKLGRRKARLAGSLVACFGILLVALSLGLYVWAGVTIVTSLAIWRCGDEWVTDANRNARAVLLAALIESLGLIQLFVHW
jgi:hypothetical protein